MTIRAGLNIIEGDITALAVDATVNAANEALAPGGGVCGAIHAAAGPGLAAECRRVGPCATGDARLTGAYHLPSTCVIHAVGPVYHGGTAGEAALLTACYRRSLELAADHDVESIAFPCISTGIFGYPREEAADIALRAMLAWLDARKSPGTIVCCCFGGDDAALYRARLAVLRTQPGC